MRKRPSPDGQRSTPAKRISPKNALYASNDVEHITPVRSVSDVNDSKKDKIFDDKENIVHKNDLVQKTICVRK